MKKNLCLMFLLLFLLGWNAESTLLDASPEARPIQIAINEDLPTLDPHQHLSVIGTAVLGNIFEPVVGRDLENKPVASIAERWESSNYQTWEFYLRPNIYFHDGSEMTMDDVIFSLERARSDPRSRVSPFLADVDSISADSASNQLTIVTARPNPFFLESLSFIMIVPAMSPAEITKPIGTGPYLFRSYQRERILRLEGFGGYWQGAPKEPIANFAIIPDPDEAVARLEAGELDLMSYLPARMVNRLEGETDLWVESRLSQSVLYLDLNLDLPPFDDPLVRQAIDLALDRDALMEEVTLNHSRPASQMLAPPILGHDPELSPTRRNIERARQLLKQAKPNQTTVLEIHTTDAFVPHAAAVKAQLEEAGFRVEIIKRPWPELYADHEKGTLGAWLGIWIFDSTDAAVFFNTVVHSRSEDGKWGGSNLTLRRNLELDEPIRAACAESDLAARRAMLQKISRRATELHASIPLLWPLDLYGARRDLIWQPRKDNGLLVYHMARKN